MAKDGTLYDYSVRVPVTAGTQVPAVNLSVYAEGIFGKDTVIIGKFVDRWDIAPNNSILVDLPLSYEQRWGPVLGEFSFAFTVRIWYASLLEPSDKKYETTAEYVYRRASDDIRVVSEHYR